MRQNQCSKRQNPSINTLFTCRIYRKPCRKCRKYDAKRRFHDAVRRLRGAIHRFHVWLRLFIVWLRRVHAWLRWFGLVISVEIHCVTAVMVFVSAFATLKSAKSCAFSANAVQISCIFVCKCCENYVRLLRILFRLRRFRLAISVEIHCVTAVRVFVSAFATLKSAKSCAFSAKEWCNAAVSMCYSSDFQLVFVENIVRKLQKCMRFLWFGSIYKRFHVLFMWLHSLFAAVPKNITEVFCQMMAKWWFCAAIAWCGNGGWRYKSLVCRFDLRCFTTLIQGFTNSNHHIPNTITQIPDTIPLFSNPNFTTFNTQFRQINTPLPCFHYAITSVSEYRLPVYNSDTRFYALIQPLSEYDYPNSWHNSLIFKPEFHHFHTPLPRFHDAVRRVLWRLRRFGCEM